jgi:hypothetical protein
MATDSTSSGAPAVMLGGGARPRCPRFGGTRVRDRLPAVASATAWLCRSLAALTDETATPGSPAAGWPAVAAVAEAEGLAPALAFGLARRPDAAVPPAVSARLTARFTAARARHVVMSRHLGVLLRALAGAGIPVIPLKGEYLADAVYPHPALRPMSDIDVLVRRGDRLRVDDMLRGLGYRRGTDAHSWAFDLAYDGATFYDGPGGARVDVHWRLLNDPRYAWNHREAEAVWDRAVPVTLAGGPALALEVEDLVLSLATHLAVHHGLSGLVWYWDLALVVTRWPSALDGDRLLARAERWGVRRALFSVLDRLGTLFALPAAVRWAARIAPRGPRAAALRWLVAHRAGDLAAFEHVIPLLLTDRGTGLVSTLGSAVWPSPRWVRARYGDDASGLARAYLAHGARMTTILGRTGRRLLGGVLPRP